MDTGRGPAEATGTGDICSPSSMAWRSRPGTNSGIFSLAEGQPGRRSGAEGVWTERRLERRLVWLEGVWKRWERVRVRAGPGDRTAARQPARCNTVTPRSVA